MTTALVKKYVMMPLSTFESDSFNGLSLGAKELLWVILAKYNGSNNGQLDVSWDNCKKSIPARRAGVFEQHRAELLKSGLLVATESATEDAKQLFGLSWVNNRFSDDHFECASRVLDYLNAKRKELYSKLSLRHRDMRAVESNLRSIRIIMRQGYTEEQIKIVIDHLVQYWGESEKMRSYLTVPTIFNTAKFESKLDNALHWKDNHSGN